MRETRPAMHSTTWTHSFFSDSFFLPSPFSSTFSCCLIENPLPFVHERLFCTRLRHCPGPVDWGPQVDNHAPWDDCLLKRNAIRQPPNARTLSTSPNGDLSLFRLSGRLEHFATGTMDESPYNTLSGAKSPKQRRANWLGKNPSLH